jgi:asparagine synthase (glutamine-hydrolysing)
MPWRGPDDSGVQATAGAAIGMCRLRVRSAADAAVPFTAPGDGAYALNGEVYAAGIEEGEADGMWAVANLAKAGTIDLRRDRWGIKPLWIREDSQEIVACSDLPALVHERGKTPPPVRPEAIAQLLLFGSVVDGGSYWKGICPLPPGSGIRLHRGTARWLPKTTPPVPAPGDAAPAKPIETALRDSIRAVLQADRPLGAAVSGGLDSTIVALHIQDAGVEDFTTISITPHRARDGIADLHTLRLPDGPHRRWCHHHVTIRPQAALAGLRRATQVAGMPTSLTSTPLYLALAEAAHEAGIVVLLVGEGADELFGGYRSYLGITQATTPADFYLDHRRGELVGLLLGPSARQGAVTALRERIHHPGAGPAAVLAHERTLSLGPLLDRTDAMMMSCSIEARTPFLHGDVPAIASRLHWTQKVNHGQTKVALRAAYADRLPAFADEIKVPFRAPWARWIREELRAEVETVLNDGITELDDLGISRVGVSSVLTMAADGDQVAAGLCFTLCSLVFWAEDQSHRRICR